MEGALPPNGDEEDKFLCHDNEESRGYCSPSSLFNYIEINVSLINLLVYSDAFKDN